MRTMTEQIQHAHAWLEAHAATFTYKYDMRAGRPNGIYESGTMYVDILEMERSQSETTSTVLITIACHGETTQLEASSEIDKIIALLTSNDGLKMGSIANVMIDKYDATDAVPILIEVQISIKNALTQKDKMI